GDRPPAGDRPPPGAFPPRWCAATGSGTAGKASAGKVARGGPAALPARREPARPGCYSPAPAAAARRIPGPRERDLCRRALPP
ncbi:hypothetical protein D2V08_01475, partial [Flagellimonas lutimaris]